MKNLLLLLTGVFLGVVLGVSVSVSAHDPSECAPCPDPAPCISAPSPEMQKAILDAKAALDAARQGPQP